MTQRDALESKLELIETKEAIERGGEYL